MYVLLNFFLLSSLSFTCVRQYLAAIWSVINFQEAEKRLVEGAAPKL